MACPTAMPPWGSQLPPVGGVVMLEEERPDDGVAREVLARPGRPARHELVARVDLEIAVDRVRARARRPERAAARTALARPAVGEVLVEHVFRVEQAHARRARVVARLLDADAAHVRRRRLRHARLRQVAALAGGRDIAARAAEALPLRRDDRRLTAGGRAEPALHGGPRARDRHVALLHVVRPADVVRAPDRRVAHRVQVVRARPVPAARHVRRPRVRRLLSAGRVGHRERLGRRARLALRGAARAASHSARPARSALLLPT